ncbi:MAG: hypothetical protein HOP15_14030 [Planctomycetes bacterium]|nr:hypothetical protein [Planctomycetota bacterium]
MVLGSHAWRRILFVVALALLATGCGAIRFQRAWSSYEPSNYEPTSHAPGTGAGMPGRWKGEWRSEWNGHSGGLRGLMTRVDDGHTRARFFSTYASLLFFTHETVFHVVGEQDGVLHFEGEQDLGQAFGGVYRYAGTVVGDSFRANFTAENGDHGVFEMQRVD